MGEASLHSLKERIQSISFLRECPRGLVLLISALGAMGFMLRELLAICLGLQHVPVVREGGGSG